MITKKRILKWIFIYFFIQIPLIIFVMNHQRKKIEKIDETVSLKEKIYTLYNLEYGYEVGKIYTTKKDNEYLISLNGLEYSDKEKYTNRPYSYENIVLDDLKLKTEIINGKTILIGKTENIVVVISKETESKYIFAKEIFNENWDYYHLLILTFDEFNKMINRSESSYSNIDFEIKRNKDCLYKACFYDDLKD